MSFAEMLRGRTWAAAALAGLLSACASKPPAPPPQPVAAAKPAAAAVVEAPVPETAQRDFNRALQAQRAGRNEEALRLYEALAKASPELGGVHANVGLLHRAAGKHAESVAALEKAVAASPKQARFWNELGVSHRHAGQFAKAQAAYERALQEDNNLAAAALNLGILQDVYQGDAAKALPWYERYLLLSPGDANVSKWVADVKKRAAGPAVPANKESS
jgi:tetratricopeptide (TPR) repeat protein